MRCGPGRIRADFTYLASAENPKIFRAYLTIWIEGGFGVSPGIFIWARVRSDLSDTVACIDAMLSIVSPQQLLICASSS